MIILKRNESTTKMINFLKTFPEVTIKMYQI